MSESRSRWLTLAAAIALFVAATTFPYRLAPPEWIENSAQRKNDIISFPDAGMAMTRRAPDWLDRIRQSKQLRLEMTFRSYSLDQFGPARILTISFDHYTRNLTVGQEGNALYVRLRHNGSDANGQPEIAKLPVIEVGKLHDVVVSVEAGQARIEVDGTVYLERTLTGEFPLTAWDPSFRLGFGNEMTWQRSWRGEIHTARLSTDTLNIDLLNEETLYLPSGKWTNVRTEIFGNWVDVAVNLILFLPVGWITAHALGRRWGPALLLWLVVIGTVEVVQLSIDGRYFSPGDILLNLSGMAIGMSIAHRSARLLQRT